MSEDTRTLLTEYPDKEKQNPLERIYSVIACRLAGMGGFECYRVKAEKMDNHYLLMRADTVHGFDWEPFGIVDLNNPNTALDRMYYEAKKLAKERASNDNNKMLDLTSRVNKITGNDKYYVPDKYIHRVSMASE